MKLIIFLLSLFTYQSALATDFSSCPFWDEQCKIDLIKSNREAKKTAEQERIEQYKRDKAERDEARRVEVEKMTQEARERENANRSFQAAEAERIRNEREEEYVKQKAEQAALAEAQQKEDEKLYQQELKREKSALNKQKKQVSDKKLQCGDDYQNPKIGMTLSRLNQCVAKVKLMSQINRADGIVSTYQAGNLVVHIMDNYVVSWTRI